MSLLSKRENGDNGCDKVSISKCSISLESLAGFGRKGKETEIFLGDRDGVNWRKADKCWHPDCLSQQGASFRSCLAELILTWPHQLSLKLKTDPFPTSPTCKLNSVPKALPISLLIDPRSDDNLWVLPYTLHWGFVRTDCSSFMFMIPFLCSARALYKIFSHLKESGFCFPVQPPTDTASFSHLLWSWETTSLYSLNDLLALLNKRCKCKILAKRESAKRDSWMQQLPIFSPLFPLLSRSQAKFSPTSHIYSMKQGVITLWSQEQHMWKH